MTLTKKKLAIITVVLVIVYFSLILILPESVIGERAENMLLFAPKAFFLGVTAAITTALILILIFKRDFVNWQIFSFSKYQHMLKMLVKRDFVTKYRKSILGVLWSLLNPLLTMLVMTVVFSYIFRNQIENFPVYLLSGSLIYGFFNESTTQSMSSVIINEAIIKKIYVPKYVFPVARVLSSLVNLVFSLIAFFLVFIITRAPFHWTILLMPVPIIYTFIFSLGVSMFLSATAVFFRDLIYLYGVFSMLLMYFTPIFYPVEILPEWAIPIYGLNPIYHFVNYFRDVAMRGTIPSLWENAVCIGYALAALCVGTYVFMRQQDKFILNL